MVPSSGCSSSRWPEAERAQSPEPKAESQEPRAKSLYRYNSTFTGGCMKQVTMFAAALLVAAPAFAQHVHDQAQHVHDQAPGAPAMQAPAGGPPPQTPPIDVPWNDAIPAG